MSTKEQKGEKREQHPTVEGKVWVVACAKCGDLKTRRHYGDARFFQREHQKPGHAVSIEQRNEPAKKESTSKSAKATYPKKKGAKKEQKS